MPPATMTDDQGLGWLRSNVSVCGSSGSLTLLHKETLQKAFCTAMDRKVSSSKDPVLGKLVLKWLRSDHPDIFELQTDKSARDREWVGLLLKDTNAPCVVAPAAPAVAAAAQSADASPGGGESGSGAKRQRHVDELQDLRDCNNGHDRAWQKLGTATDGMESKMISLDQQMQQIGPALASLLAAHSEQLEDVTCVARTHGDELESLRHRQLCMDTDAQEFTLKTDAAISSCETLLLTMAEADVGAIAMAKSMAANKRVVKSLGTCMQQMTDNALQFRADKKHVQAIVRQCQG
jgi:hypothetical protein